MARAFVDAGSGNRRVSHSARRVLTQLTFMTSTPDFISSVTIPPIMYIPYLGLEKTSIVGACLQGFRGSC